MKPKFSYATEAEIPAELKAHYKESGGRWWLDVEGAVSAEKVAEFRDSSTKALKLLSKVTGKETVTDADVDAVTVELADLRSKKATFEGVDAKEKAKYETALEARVGEMKTAHEAERKKLQDELERKSSKLNEIMVDKAVVEAAGKFGLREGAALDLVARARGVWSLDGERIVARGDGKDLYGANAEPLSMDEWLEKHVVPKAGHLFEPSKGAGAPGGGKGPSGNGLIPGLPPGGNPWDPKTFNMGQQGAIFQKDPALASKMAAQHGIALGTGAPA